MADPQKSLVENTVSGDEPGTVHRIKDMSLSLVAARQRLERIPGLKQIGNRLRTVSMVRGAYENLDLWLKFGRLRPDSITIRNSDHRLFVDVREPRGRALARGFAAGQPHLKNLWVRAIDGLTPDLVIDVGVNYGEFLFLPSYPPTTQVIGLEPIPGLHAHLEKSRQSHPDGDRIRLVSAAAQHEVGTVKLWVDRQWSGRSSLALSQKKFPVEPVSVAATTLDTLTADLSPRTVVAKN